VADVTIDESAGVAEFVVGVSPAPAAGESLAVSFQTADGTALAGTDYAATSGALTFTEGQTVQTVQVPIIDDAESEGEEQFALTVSATGAASVTGTATILASDLGVSGCGAPTYDPMTDAGLYLWEEGCGTGTERGFRVRASAGGSATAMTYAGHVDADQAFGTVTGFSLESSDTVEQVDGGLKILYQLNVRKQYEDGFDFSVGSGTGVCFGLDLPAGTPVLVGPNATPVATPFDLTTYQACAAPPPPPPVAEICGAPSYDPATDPGLYLWEEGCGGTGHSYQVRASAGGSASTLTYAGGVTSSEAFNSVTPYSLEGTDVLTNTGLQVDYSLNVRQAYQDGFDFSTADGASVCFGLDLPVGTPVRVGVNATPVAAPFDVASLEPCR